MVLNYFKIAIRNILRHKVYSIINIGGLSVGMACTILILLWVQYELSFDRYHENADRIYRLATYLDIGEMHGRFAISCLPIGPTLQRDYPEVIKAVRFLGHSRNILVQYKTKKFLEDGILYAENAVFDVFTFPLISGDPKAALAKADSVVITEAMAKKYFGAENPIGKILKFEDRLNLKVTGVMRNVPPNSHSTFNMLLSWELLKGDSWYKKKIEDWMHHDIYTYLLLRDKHDAKELEKKFPALIQRRIGEILETIGGNIEYFLQPLTDIHLHSDAGLEISGNGDIVQLYVLTLIGLFILLIACINFMNLSTARSVNRAKEVGVRKVLGANRSNLIYRFFGESAIFSFFSLLVAICLVELFIPLFRSLTGSETSFAYINMLWLILTFMALMLFVAFFAGCYPALFLSAFQPIRVLTGTFKAGKTNRGFRNTFFVVQFSISIALIIGTAIIFNQLSYVRHKPLGFDKDRIVYLRVRNSSIWQSLDSIKAELKSHTEISGVTSASNVPGQLPSHHVFVPEGFNTNQSQLMHHINVDPDFITTMGIEITAGRNFSLNFSSDISEAILLNETAVQQFRWDQPIGKKITLLEDEQVTKIVIGVIKDYHIRSLHHKIEPLYIDYEPSRFRYIIIKIKPGSIPQAMRFLMKKWEALQPAFPFEYFFLDETFDQQYKFDEKLGETFSYSALLAIFIACLGLFGLASFTTEQRTKEIGIRKALGDSVSGIILLLIKEFTKWVLVANVIAWPIAYWAMNRWLQNFAYRINVGLGTFVLAALLALVIALLTVGYQAIKAGRANPVEALRYE